MTRLQLDAAELAQQRINLAKRVMPEESVHRVKPAKPLRQTFGLPQGSGVQFHRLVHRRGVQLPKHLLVSESNRAQDLRRGRGVHSIIVALNLPDYLSNVVNVTVGQ